MSVFRKLQDRHEELLTQLQNDAENGLSDAAFAYIEQARRDSRQVSSPLDREQLKANLRFWANYYFEATGVYPNTELTPAKVTSTSAFLPFLFASFVFLVIIILGWFLWLRSDIIQGLVNWTPTLTPTLTPGPCNTAKIRSPEGAKSMEDAIRCEVENEVEITWEPSNCIMVVQSYEVDNPDPIEEYRDVTSGTKLKIGEPGSGLTEIKIWVEGFSVPSDNIWVCIK